MGDPRRLKRKYETPRHPFEKERITEERALVQRYGLKNKREVWIAKGEARKYRRLARKVLGLPAAKKKKEAAELLKRLVKMKILKKGGAIDDVLEIKAENILERRLQTIVWRKGLARTITQARQLIAHGHIALNGRKVTAPGMIIDAEGEKRIGWYGNPVVTPEKVRVERKREKKEVEVG